MQWLGLESWLVKFADIVSDSAHEDQEFPWLHLLKSLGVDRVFDCEHTLKEELAYVFLGHGVPPHQLNVFLALLQGDVLLSGASLDGAVGV